MSDFNQTPPQNNPTQQQQPGHGNQTQPPFQNQWQSSQWQSNSAPSPIYSPPQYQPQAGMDPPPGYLQKSRIAAGLLALTMGMLGIHSFYMGNTSKGLIQLLVSILGCGIGAVVIQILSIIEGVKILDGRINTDAYGIYLK